MKIAGIKPIETAVLSEPNTLKTPEVSAELRKYTVKKYLKYSV